MYEMALALLKAAEISLDGMIVWVHEQCGCTRIRIGGVDLLVNDSSPQEVDLARSALFHLVSMNFVRAEEGGYRITNEGLTFARSFDVPDDLV